MSEELQPKLYSPTVAQLGEEYKAHAFPRFSSRTQQLVALELRRFALFVGQRELTGKIILEYMDAQFKRTKEAETLNLSIYWMNVFLRWGENMGYFTLRFSSLVPLMAVVQKPPLCFSPGQYERIKALARGTPLHYAIIFAYRTGARLSDTCLLKWESVNMEELHVRYIPFKTRKTGRYATCPFLAGGDLHEVLKELDQARDRRPHWDQFVCSELAMKYSTFGRDGGDPVLASNFRKLCIAIGAPRLSFHKLRNSWMSRAVSSGTPFPQITQMSGLGSFSVLMRYARPDIPALRTAMERMDALDAPQEERIMTLPAA